jgi:hypothetical protein
VLVRLQTGFGADFGQHIASKQLDELHWLSLEHRAFSHLFDEEILVVVFSVSSKTE